MTFPFRPHQANHLYFGKSATTEACAFPAANGTLDCHIWQPDAGRRASALGLAGRFVQGWLERHDALGMEWTTMPDTPRASTRGFVYFLQDEDGFVKIGHAQDVKARVAVLQTASRQTLRLLGAMPGGRREEAALHRRFAPTRARGEWFAPTPTLLVFAAKHDVQGSRA